MLKLILAIALFFGATASFAQETPVQVTAAVLDDIVVSMRSDKSLRSGDPQALRRLVDNKVLPYFDVSQMAQLAVGKHWRSATPEQQAQLSGEFYALLLRTYSSALKVILDYSYTVKSSLPQGTSASVKATFSKSGAPPLDIVFSMESDGDTWKVFDITVDNVSLVTTYRNSFSKLIRTGGIDGLIAELQAKNASVARN